MLTQNLVIATSTGLLFFLVVSPHYTLSTGEYGDFCNNDTDCISADTLNPLICLDPNEGTTTTESAPSTTTTTAPTTPTTTPTTTTTTLSTTTEDTEGSTTTTEDSEEPTTTTEDSEGPTTTTEDSEEPTTTTEDSEGPTTTTEDSEEPTTTTEDFKGSTTTTEDSEGSTATTENSENNSTSIKEPFIYDLTNIYDKHTSYPVCGCPSDMIRDIDLHRCVSPPSGSCDRRYGDGSHKRTCTKFAECYPDPEDESKITGLCYCNSDATVDPVSNTCRLNHGSNRCVEHTDCDIRNWLTCHNSTCVCMYEGIQKWNPTEKQCGFIVGESCAEHPPFPTSVCVDNAVCLNETKTCTCESNYRVTPEGECKLPHNASCSNDNDCHPYFKCTKNICTCQEDQMYYGSTEKCHIPEWSPCNASVDSCTLGAECKNEICICSPGYLATSEHTCHALVNSECSNEVPCHADQYLKACSTSQTHSYCECLENYRYHAASNRCIGNVDEACNIDEDCIDHAICMPIGTCNCGGDYIPGENKTACYTSYGKSCSGIECYPRHFLKCNQDDFTCVCASNDDQIFDENKGYCVALVGRFCGGSAGGIQCVEHSICGVENLDTKCKCLVGYTANSAGFCIKSNEASSAEHLKNAKNYMHIIIHLFSLIIMRTCRIY